MVVKVFVFEIECNLEVEFVEFVLYMMINENIGVYFVVVLLVLND